MFGTRRERKEKINQLIQEIKEIKSYILDLEKELEEIKEKSKYKIEDPLDNKSRLGESLNVVTPEMYYTESEIIEDSQDKPMSLVKRR